jgi:hypothetical protein
MTQDHGKRVKGREGKERERESGREGDWVRWREGKGKRERERERKEGREREGEGEEKEKKILINWPFQISHTKD